MAVSQLTIPGVRQEIAAAKRSTPKHPGRAYNVEYAPATATTVEPLTADRTYVYGWYEADQAIHRSADQGVTWSAVCGLPTPDVGGARPRLMHFTADGEVLITFSRYIYKSTGWPASGTTWRIVHSVDPYNAQFMRWGVDGDGTKFIATAYSSGENFAESRIAAISTDAGSTFTAKYDSASQFPDQHTTMHLHGCCYDRWGDVFYLIDAHHSGHAGEGNKNVHAIMYSTDDGDTWQRLAGGWADEANTTVIAATQNGLVLGSDHSATRPQGIYAIRRTDDPADGELVPVYTPRVGYNGIGTYIASSAWWDEDTGLVYIGFQSTLSNVPVVIGASDGLSGGEVWNSYGLDLDVNDGINNGIHRPIVTPDGRSILAAMSLGVNFDRWSFRCRITPPGTVDPYSLDTGGAGGGERVNGHPSSAAIGAASRTTGQQSTAVGVGSRSHDRGVAIGNSASIVNDDGTALGSVAVGYAAQAKASNAVAVGRESVANVTSGVAVGYAAQATGEAGTAIGRESQAGNQSTVVGWGAVATGTSITHVGASTTVTATLSAGVGHSCTVTGNNAAYVGRGVTISGSNAVAFGYTSTASGLASCVFGNQAQATATSAIAIGQATVASHQASIAMGRSAASTQAQEFAVGSTANANFRIDHLRLGISSERTPLLHMSYSGSTTTWMAPPGLPTSDPAVAGQIWNDGGTLKVSAG